MRKEKSMLAVGLLAVAALLAGCGGSSKYSDYSGADYGYSAGAASSESYDTAYPQENAAVTEMAVEYEYDMSKEEYAAADEYYEGESGAGEAAEILDENGGTAERKLIKTVDLYVETENYDALIANLENQITLLGGYVEYQYQYNGSNYGGYDETRSARLEVRIPAKRLDEFVVKVGEESNITNKEERVEDVTLQYVDLESHKKALLIEQERLLTLLEKAETIEDIIALEQRLSDVRYMLESMESQLRTLMNQVEYSTVNLSIQEVKRLTPVEEKSAWDKMKNGFVKSIYRIGDDIEYEMIRFVINIPYFIIWIVIIIIVILILKAIAKRRKAKLAEMKEKASSLFQSYLEHKKYKRAKRRKEMTEWQETEKTAKKEAEKAEQSAEKQDE